ncbi:MAG: SUMF1/EgtB/PvdO family nonheme iron enzyme [Acaryochloris sp. RU_4_1]|nr:SUMF1/EgtB/PvdO family nonheme iron enzyme [Acaryochloris sp. RU_4_1]NJR55108.1 SUMF1/EgtB/PvdO family nonheme iron enzyme [Acaryochloris sp. CRU_2_0]
MRCCLNPDCEKPFNPDTHKHCQQCGSRLIDLLSDRFKVLKPLDRGGFGKIYLAEDTHNHHQHCVIKQLAYQSQGTWAIQRAEELFTQEAQQLHQLGQHPQIPSLYAYFTESANLYLAQEFIEGHTLLKELQQKGLFSETQIRELLLNILPVLRDIHVQGVIHRDLKPENIMRKQEDGTLVLIDFGVSRRFTESVLTKTGTTLGSQGYAALEQMQAGKSIPASDLFSLGVSCFQLMTNKVPYTLFLQYGYSWISQWNQHLKTPISDHLRTVLGKLLQNDLRLRYGSAASVLADLQTRHVVDIPTVSAPNTLSQLSVAPTTLVSSQPHNQPAPLSSKTLLSAQQPVLHSFKFEVITMNPQGEVIKRVPKVAEGFHETLSEGVQLEMVSIPSGRFMMGSPSQELDRDISEGPYHAVEIAAFFMGKYEITQLQWRAVSTWPKVTHDLHYDPSKFKGANYPVEQVSWLDAIEFCARLSQQMGRDYRLPSEAEWEYACRAGTVTPFAYGSTITSEQANYQGQFSYGSGSKGVYRQSTTPVGRFPANAFGLYDMHGNVYEWCLDCWHKNYDGAPTDGRPWLTSKETDPRVLRGGSWYNKPRYCRAANRSRYAPHNRINDIGFRVALTLLPL